MKLPVRRRLVVSTVAAVVVVGGGSALLVRHGGSGSTQYRTASATLGTVTQTLALSGNLTPVNQSNLDFNSSGKITAVDVQPGQQVAAGQVLATLDAASLQASLTQAQAVLSSAQAKVSLDQSGPTAQNLSQSQGQMRSAQATVTSDETALKDSESVDQQAIDAAQSALAACQSTQKAVADAPTPTPSPSPTATPSPTAAPTPTPTPKPTPKPTPSCSVAQDTQALSAANSKYTQDQHQAEGQLTNAETQLQNAQSAFSTADQGATAQQLAQDQAQVQVDQVNVANAQIALQGASITAPTAGLVGQVNITVGQLVSGGGGSSGASSSSSSSSGTYDIVVLSPGAFEVTGSVSDTQVNQVAAGQAAEVSVAGVTHPIQGKVTSVAANPTVTAGVASFPVTVVLDGTNSNLRTGVSAAVSVVINQVENVLTVPTSAVRPNGAGDTVETLVDNQTVNVPVTLGASGPLRTQILTGLTQGQTVVVATLSSVVPTPNVSSLTGGGGGFRATTGGGGGGGRGAGGAAGGGGGRG